MSVQIVTGRPRAMAPALYGALKAALKEKTASPLYVLVPEQYTLQSERDIFAALRLPGSFRLQVMSTARLIARLFQSCGAPDEARVDERGRVMLMHAALRETEDELQWYRGAQRMTGFAEKAALQVRELKQSGLTAAGLEALAQRLSGPVARKAQDLARVWARYDETLKGRYIDGEDELMRALPLIDRAEFLDGARVFLSGYELISPTLAPLAAQLALHHEVTWFMPCVIDRGAPDAAAYAPVLKRIQRFEAMAKALGAECRRVEAPDVGDSGRPDDLNCLVNRINAIPVKPWVGEAPHIELWLGRNPYDEALCAVADIRRRVMDGEMRYRDAAIVCYDLQGMSDPLQRAAALYEVPMFLSEGRGADRNPLCLYALTALRLIDGYLPEDMETLMRTGYTALGADECDMMCDAAVEQGLKGHLWKRPLRRGSLEQNERCEPLRQRLMAPLAAFEESFREARDTRGQLQALWTFLETSGAYERLEATQAECARTGLTEAANENAQAWNRLLGTLDQLNELMGDAQLTARELYDMLRQALAASDIRPLPQSGDAVMAGSLSHLRSGAVERLYVLGCNELGAATEGTLLAAHERAYIQSVSDIWLAPDQVERTNLSALDLDTTLGMARGGVVLSWSSSDLMGGALQPGPVISRVRRLFPALRARPADSGDRVRALYGAPEAALTRLGPAIGHGRLPEEGLGALAALRDWAAARPGTPDPLAALNQAAQTRTNSSSLDAGTARALYGGPEYVSVTRLEQFAQCPFKHFVQYGLSPTKLKPYALERTDEGTFYHDALERFLSGADDAGRLTSDEAVSRMDDVSEALMSDMMDGPLGDSPVMLSYARRMRAIARQAAATVIRHLETSRFEPVGVEIPFGPREGTITLETPEGRIPLRGRIDRVDSYAEDDKRYFRVIDYKSGATKLSLKQVYFGLQLQLLIYLAVTLKRYNDDRAKPAGTFYFHVADPCVDTLSRDRNEIDQLRVKELRLDGLFLDEEGIKKAMAEDPGQVIVARSGTAGISADDFQLLLDHALTTATALAGAIMEGHTEIAPLAVDKKSPCAWCDARAACHQDPLLGGTPMPPKDDIGSSDVLPALRKRYNG